MLTDVPHVGAQNFARPPFEIFDLSLPPDCPDIPGIPDNLRDDWIFRAAQMLLAQPCDAAITGILELTGLAANADRAWMFEYDKTLLRFRNTHEWCRETVTSHITDLQDTPVTMIAWLQQFLSANQAVMINDVGTLPRPARDLQAEMLRQNDKSVLCIPVFFEGRLRACIGFDATRGHIHWTNTVISALSSCSALIALARYGNNIPAQQNKQPLARLSADPLIYIRTYGRSRGVTSGEIVGLRSARDYTTLYLSDGSSMTDLRPLSVWAGMLPSGHFHRIHRTTIVNLHHIAALDRHAGKGGDRWEIRLRIFDEIWTVSRPYRRELRSKLGV
ncbi:LytTR family transcriptional regulator DNA-binding domain-containing protein [Thalassospira lucentensis]|uniref:GAF domain-containing DNA-binding protein n=1 Tax=Thalassospira lucentensis TaxID=168935 RepID=UPI003AA95E60